MRVMQFRMSSELSTKELADIFQETSHALVARVVAGFRRALGQGDNGGRLEFFTPKDDSPFTALDDDRPAFSVGALIPKTWGNSGGVTAVQIHIWDRGELREAVVAAPHSITSSQAARKALEKFAAEFKAARPTTHIEWN